MNRSTNFTINIFAELEKKRRIEEEYVETLKDNTNISFYRELEDDEKDDYLQIEESNKKSKILTGIDYHDDDNDLIVTIAGKMYVNDVNIAMLNEPTFKDKILDADKIVYPFSCMKITFNYPCMDNLTFDVYSGTNGVFTMHCLIKQVLKYYRFIHSAHMHFDLESGKWNDTILIKNDLFKNTLGSYWFDCDITGLLFNKKTNEWIVQYNKYC